jgi:hypothetical protein
VNGHARKRVHGLKTGNPEKQGFSGFPVFFLAWERSQNSPGTGNDGHARKRVHKPERETQ